MQRVSVRGADGQKAILALVRVEKGTAYVCPISRYTDVEKGDEEAVVGFPKEDVQPVN